jgi:hypothetical protein
MSSGGYHDAPSAPVGCSASLGGSLRRVEGLTLLAPRPAPVDPVRPALARRLAGGAGPGARDPASYRMHGASALAVPGPAERPPARLPRRGWAGDGTGPSCPVRAHEARAPYLQQPKTVLPQ